MIARGSATRIVPLGYVGEKVCWACRLRRGFHLFMSYRNTHLFYVFASTAERRFYERCSLCRWSYEVDPPLEERWSESVWRRLWRSVFKG